MRFDMTQNDITEGREANNNYCPVARVITRQTRQSVSVGCRKVRIGGREEPYDLPIEAMQFIADFDRDRWSVQPISFELDYNQGGH